MYIYVYIYVILKYQINDQINEKLNRFCLLDNDQFCSFLSMLERIENILLVHL